MSAFGEAGAWVAGHKKAAGVIAGAGGGLLLLLYIKHRNTAQTNSATSGTTGATTDSTSGQYLIPVDGSQDLTGGGGGGGGYGSDSGLGPTFDDSSLVAAITGLTTTLTGLETQPPSSGTPKPKPKMHPKPKHPKKKAKAPAPKKKAKKAPPKKKPVHLGGRLGFGMKPGSLHKN